MHLSVSISHNLEIQLLRTDFSDKLTWGHIDTLTKLFIAMVFVEYQSLDPPCDVSVTRGINM